MTRLRVLTAVSLVFGLTLLHQPFSEATALPCLDNFQDIKWANGQPDEVSKLLNPNLVLFSLKVTAPASYNFGGVTQIYTSDGVFSSDFINARTSHPILMIKTVGDQLPGSRRVERIDASEANRFFGLKLNSVRMGAKPEQVPIKVSYTYAGAQCSNRTVGISSYLEISPITTYDLTTMTEDELQIFFNGNLSNNDFLKLRRNIAAIQLAGKWGLSTKKNPIPVVFPRIVKIDQRMKKALAWNLDFEVNTLLTFLNDDFRSVISYVDSTDGCLTNSSKDPYIQLNWTDAYLSGKASSCPVYVHIFDKSGNSQGYPLEDNSAQIVIKAWVRKYVDSPNLTKVKKILCTNGTDFKTIVSANPRCSTGFSKVDSRWFQ